MLDIATKWMLYNFCESSHGSPPKVKRIELCLFHFFDVFPDVSSQYNHRGTERTCFSLARTCHGLTTGQFQGIRDILGSLDLQIPTFL